ncbi:oligoribonuclease [Ostreibacterium oceani]|uniref:Oligoribonuclease n=1 Tax=Ostreibacterium oceani TaxID=2654998 RepID=A0A6N7EWT6_9GAMM|nr:oligoribonuclease [Ostreibacterium oceani]MPV86045.1 oligoribonuclease [Ostreibacterium oceani]
MTDNNKSRNNLIWIDLEMTGLCQKTDEIIEIATVITDSHLQVLAEGPVIAIHQPQDVLAQMDDWNQRQHRQSGLYTRVQNATATLREAELETLAFISQYVPKGASPMAGNSICQDRRFLARQMPELEAWFHYRNLDVSTLKELARRWYPNAAKSYQKNSNHLALDDVYDSIDELKHYRETIMVSAQPAEI